MRALFRFILIAMKYLILIACFAFLMIGCQPKENEGQIKVDFKSVQHYVVKNLGLAITITDSLNQFLTDKEKCQTLFIQARSAYKKAEPFAAYLNSENATRVNGPPLPVYREDNGKVLTPIGYQAIEEQLYAEEEIDTTLLKYRLYVLNGYLQNLKLTAENTAIGPKQFFIPTHLQLMRVFALGVTSFDTPTSLRGIEESVISLQALKDVYEMSIADTVNLLDSQLHNDFIKNLNASMDYLRANDDFDSFDRYTFGRDHINKLIENWVKIRQLTGLFDDPKNYAINLDAPTFFESNSFNTNYFRSTYNSKPTDEQIKVGEQLFFDPKLSESENLSCASCHIPEKAYQDGLTVGTDKGGQPLQRNTPTIINSIYQKKFFWDGRSDNLEQQISVVFANKKEFNQSAHSISTKVLQDTAYIRRLKKAYPNKDQITKNQLIRALASYTSTLNAMNSRFDKNMRGEVDDFTQEEIKGMNLFMGKALCATCHFVPLTNGTVPPAFKETEKEILGTPETAANQKLDDDLGFYWVFEEEIHKSMFKTPTVRNIELTAPYMHNGVYSTLEEVMDFYNKGGGAGLGFDVEHQTLPFDSLNLNDNEIKALIAFMKTLTDTRITTYGESQ